MSQQLTVKQVGVADASVVAILFSEFNALIGADGLADEQAFLPEHVNVGSAQMARRLEGMAGVERTFVATMAGEPAGLACLRLVPYIGQDVPYAELTQLYVRERFRRRGVGAALIAAAERAAVKAGATCVHIITGRDNTGAQAFYRERGYEAPGIELEKYFTPEPANV